nr:hypothetical protein Itr_chr06CG17110 [Ipomoea trifida]
MKKKEQSMLKNDDKKGIGVDEDDNIDENMEKGGYEEDVGHEYLEENYYMRTQIEEEDIDDDNLDEGYEEEDSGEGYLEAEHKVKNHEIYIVDNLEEGYEEEEAIDIGIGKYLEGEHKEEDEKEYENLDEGYAGEYLEGEGEHQEKNEISIDEDLEEDGCTIICDGVVTVKALKHLVHAFGVERGTATHEESVSTALVLSADLLRELRLKPANRGRRTFCSNSSRIYSMKSCFGGSETTALHNSKEVSTLLLLCGVTIQYESVARDKQVAQRSPGFDSPVPEVALTTL